MSVQGENVYAKGKKLRVSALRCGLALLLVLVAATVCVLGLRAWRARGPRGPRTAVVPSGPFREEGSRYPLPKGETSTPTSVGTDARSAVAFIAEGPDGGVVVGAHVFVLVEGAIEDIQAVLGRAATDRKGIARLDLPAGVSRFDLTAVARRLLPIHRTGCTVVENSLIRLRFERGARLAGRVVGPEDRSLAGAEVYALGPGIPATPKSIAALPLPAFLDRAVATTPADGTFVLEGLRPGHRYTVAAQKDGYAAPYASSVDTLAVLAGGEPVQLVLYPAYRLRYRIVDPVTGELPADPALWPDPVSKGTDVEGASFAAGIPPIALRPRRPWEEDELWVAPAELPRLGPIAVSLRFPGYEPLAGQVFAPRWRRNVSVEPTVLSLRRSPSWRDPGSLRFLFRQPDGRPVVERDVFGQAPVCVLRAVDGGKEGLQFVFRPGPEGEMRFVKVPARRYYFMSQLGLVSRSIKPVPFDVHAGRETDVVIRFPPVGQAQFTLQLGAAVPPFIQIELDRIPPLRRPLKLYAMRFQNRRTGLPYLPEGHYIVRLVGHDFAAGPFELEIRAGQTTELTVADGGRSR